MELVSGCNSSAMDSVTKNPHTFRYPSTLVTGIDKREGRLHDLFGHVGHTWYCRMINILCQDFVRGSGIRRPSDSALFGANEYLQLFGTQQSPQSNTMVAPSLVHI